MLSIASAWSCFDNTVSTFNADGTGRATNNFTCRRHVLDAAARRIEIRWNNRQWVDTLVFSADDRSLSGANQRNMRVSGTRRQHARSGGAVDKRAGLAGNPRPP